MMMMKERKKRKRIQITLQIQTRRTKLMRKIPYVWLKICFFEIVQHFHSISVLATGILFLVIVEKYLLEIYFQFVFFSKYFSLLTSSFNI